VRTKVTLSGTTLAASIAVFMVFLVKERALEASAGYCYQCETINLPQSGPTNFCVAREHSWGFLLCETWNNEPCYMELGCTPYMWSS
jgi:hypothetical protein